MMRTYCCMSGVAMDCPAKDCVECSGLGPHRDVPGDICGHAVGCGYAEDGNGHHAHHCELEPNHDGKCQAPIARKQCGY